MEFNLVRYIGEKATSLRRNDESRTAKWCNENRLRDALKELAENGSLEEILSVIR